MKKNAFIGLLLLWVLAFISCNNENNIPTKVDTNFDKIGEIHNAGLDYILENLHIDKVISRSSASSEVHEISAVIYAQVNELSSQYITQLIAEEDTDVHDDFRQYGGESKLLSDIVAIDNSSLEVDDAAKVLSKEANIYLSQYLRLVDSQYDSDADFQNKLRAIGSLITEKFTTVEEQMILLPVTSVGEYSFQYWNENAWKWYAKFGTYGYEMKSQVRSKIWKSDVAGGAVAGLHLWFSGTGAALAATGPSGWTAIGMIIAGKSLQASACALLVSIWSDQGKIAT